MFRALLLGMMTLTLLACANQKVQVLYDGAEEEAVLIQSSDTVLIKYVDDDSVADGFIGQEIRYRVAPGKHTLIVEYSDLFDINADEFDKVVSRPAKITFQTESGKKYSVGNPKQKTLEQSKAFAENPEFIVTELGSNKTVEASVEMSRPRTFMTQIKSVAAPVYEFDSDRVSPEPDSIPAATGQTGQAAGSAAAVSAQGIAVAGEQKGEAAPVLPENIPSPLLILQQVWDRASPAEQAEFLRWIKVRK